jgi:hypothetical protein
MNDIVKESWSSNRLRRTHFPRRFPTYCPLLRSFLEFSDFYGRVREPEGVKGGEEPITTPAYLER